MLKELRNVPAKVTSPPWLDKPEEEGASRESS
jgi:hypothetical protein